MAQRQRAFITFAGGPGSVPSIYIAVHNSVALQFPKIQCPLFNLCSARLMHCVHKHTRAKHSYIKSDKLFLFSFFKRVDIL